MSLPEGWRKTAIGELVELAQGVAINKKTNHVLCEESEGLPLLKINNLVNNTVDQYANPSLVPPKAILELDDIVFTRTGQVGWVFTKKVGILHNNSFKVIPSNKLDKKFLYWFLKQNSIYTYVQKVASGSAQPDLNHDAFKTITIRYPIEIEEQKAIANILSSFDEKIELLKEQNETLEQMAQGVFREWFVDKIDENWEVKTLGEVTNIKGGATPSTKNEDFWNGDIHWTSPKDLSNSKSVFLLDTNKKITEAGLKKISSGLLPRGTLLLSSRAPIGYLAISNVDVAINQGYIALLDDAYFSNYYMYFWLKTYMRLVEGASNGSTFQEISKSAFRQIECIVPNKENIEKFDDFIKSIFDKLLLNIEEIKTLQKTRDTLLPKLMSGEVRVL